MSQTGKNYDVFFCRMNYILRLFPKIHFIFTLALIQVFFIFHFELINLTHVNEEPLAAGKNKFYNVP